MSRTRRAFLATVAASVTLLPQSVSASISYGIEYIFEIDDEIRRPDEFTYDMARWRDSGVLRFEDTDVLRFGDENRPPEDDGDGFVGGDRFLRIDGDITDMDPGNSILIVGMMSLLLGAGVTLKNWAALILWAIALAVLIIIGLFGLGIELFWLVIVAVVLMLVVGLVVRWSQS